MRMIFVLSKPSHKNGIIMSNVNRTCVDEDDDFHLVGVQSCARQSSFTQMVMLSCLHLVGARDSDLASLLLRLPLSMT
jgi:hypothetical protein